MITRQQVDQLLQFQNGRYLVTSCYLNLDRAQLSPDALKIRVKDLLRSARHNLDTRTATHEQRESLQRDFDQIEDHVQKETIAGRHRALALFSCAGEKFWQVYPLPRQVRNILVADHSPYVRPLKVILAQEHRYGVVLVDRVHGHIFEMYMGELLEHKELLGDVPRWANEGGQGGREERNIERCYNGAVRQHFQNVAEAAFKLFQQDPFDRLLLGGHHETLVEFKEHLHPYLKARLAGEFTADPSRINLPDVLRQSQQIAQHLAAEHEKTLAADLVHKAVTGRAVTGVAATLTALGRGEVQLLLVEEGYEAAGYWCPQCQHLDVDSAICSQCQQPAELCPDVVDKAVELAMLKSCRIEQVQGHTPLREAGRIGALLRY